MLSKINLNKHKPGENLVESTAPVPTCIVARCEPFLASSTMNLPSVVPITSSLPL